MERTFIIIAFLLQRFALCDDELIKVTKYVFFLTFRSEKD